MERDQFKRLWLKGGGFIEGVRALKNQAIVAFFISRRRPLLLSFVVLLLCLLIFQVIQVGWQFFWVVPNQKLAADRVTPSWKRELTQKEAHELQNSIRQTFMQAIGGAALLLGFFFTAWTLRISQKTLRVTQEGHITERFTKAIEHLGDNRLTVQLGGIYALERIARKSPDDHWQIMEVLTAFVRDNAPSPSSAPVPSPKLATNIQAILMVLGRRDRSSNREDERQLVLDHTDLQKADLRKAHLERADLSGANLEDARLDHAYLEEADLYGAHLERATLTSAHLKKAFFSAASLQAVDFSGAHLEEAYLGHTHLEGANFSGAHMEGADLRLACLKKAVLGHANLKGANFSGAHLEGADLRHTHLEGANFSGANLKEADLDHAHLERAVLTIEQLATVLTLKGAFLDPPLREQLKTLGKNPETSYASE